MFSFNKRTKLKDIASVYQPKTISTSSFKKDGYPVYGANGVIGYYDKYNHTEDQILVSCRGENCGVINYSYGKTWITGNTMVVKINEETKLDKLFLFYQLQSQNLKYLISGSGQPQIIKKSLDEHEIKLTDYQNQQKIGSFLSAIDDYINKIEKNRTTLILRKQHYYSCLFNKKLRFKDAKSNDFPNWTQIKLNDYGEFFKGTSYSRDDISETGKNLILYGDLFTIYDGRINDTFNKTQSSYPNEVFARPGDVLFPGSTTVDAYSLISPSTLYCESVIGGDVIVYRTSKIRPLYLTYLIIGKLKKHFSKFAQGTTIIHIYSSNLGDIEFESSTSLEEQTKLEGFFDKFDKLVKLNNEKIEKMKSLKKYYLKEIFKSTEV